MQRNHPFRKYSLIEQEIKREPATHYVPCLYQHTGIGWQARSASLLTALVLGLSIWFPALAANQIDIVGPPGSSSFGASITLLANGNFIVIDPGYDIPGGATDVGAVYLYNGATHTLISTLTGSTSGDQIGSDGLKVLSNGNYLVLSHLWDNGSATDAGAVTWGSSTSGVSGEVSNNNSLVGSTNGDQVGNAGVYTLSNSNYVVLSPNWDNGSLTDVGAATWGNGNIGVSDVVSSSNSLVGSTSSDWVGNSAATLTNGNYVVISPYWDRGSVTDAGAVTWGNGNTGSSGEVNSSNSLVGSTSIDRVGGNGVAALTNGNYVVISSLWDKGSMPDAGAATWGNGSTGINGEVSTGNSLFGHRRYDWLGNLGVHALRNGNYLVLSPNIDYVTSEDIGAVTWGNGNTGISGEVSPANSFLNYMNVVELTNSNYVMSSTRWGGDLGAVVWANGSTGIVGQINSPLNNSLVGSIPGDLVSCRPEFISPDGDIWCSSGIIPLNNGNFLVISPFWHNGNIENAGAVTWINGSTGIVGAVNSSNSLVGSIRNEKVGNWGVQLLSNGNYLVFTNSWGNSAGAVTWGDGNTGVSGEISSSNSLVGRKGGDQIGSGGVTELSNGNYVVSSPNWHNDSMTDVGAVTWVNGSTGFNGEVSSNNSLVGSKTGDMVVLGVTSLSNGNYVVSSPYWDNGSMPDIGAVTWVNGSTVFSGEVNSSNSLIGSTNSDRVGNFGVTVLSNGNYVVNSPLWDNGSMPDAGAVTWANGSTGIVGEISINNSLIGSMSYDIVGHYYIPWVAWNIYNNVRAMRNGNYVVVSSYWDNGAIPDAGAVTWVNGNTGISGPILSSNSLLGMAASGGTSMNIIYNTIDDQVIVGRPVENTISFLYLPEESTENLRLYLPAISQ